jgi:hypothetical protein
MSTPSATEQARLRRERREKKILAQGNSRLEKIAGLQGGAPAREAIQVDKAEHPTVDHPDPPELDISEFGSPNAPSPGDLRSAVTPGRNLFGVDGDDEVPFYML